MGVTLGPGMGERGPGADSRMRAEQLAGLGVDPGDKRRDFVLTIPLGRKLRAKPVKRTL